MDTVGWSVDWDYAFSLTILMQSKYKLPDEPKESTGYCARENLWQHPHMKHKTVCLRFPRGSKSHRIILYSLAENFTNLRCCGYSQKFSPGNCGASHQLFPKVFSSKVSRYTVGNRVIPLLNCLTIDTVQLLDKATPFQTVFCLLLCDNTTFY